MRYQSTRDKKISLTASEAIARGLSREGGLFVPEILPKLPTGALKELCNMTYQQRAVYVMSMFLEDFTVAELNDYIYRAYGPKGFDSPKTAPVHKADSGTYFLELWHGPTCAFKDMALQILPYLLTASLKKSGEERTACILVATSGDTGKAALEGFCDVPKTKIMVFYPKDGVSDVQKLQMTSQGGSNVGVCAVTGNFDDAQTGVKNIFSDEGLREDLSKKGYFLSSANSINWGRLLPQIVYYISAYCDIVKKDGLKLGDKINFSVPTGNFGDILAGYYAMRIGLPVNKFICASNMNDVLTEFIATGVYDRNRKFYTTISPSMDILVSSNLERLIFELCGKNDELVSEYMKALSSEGRYEVSGEIKSGIEAVFACGSSTDNETKALIARTFGDSGYLIDTHTAVAYSVLNKYREKTGDITPAVVVSTASPYKFCDSVLDALGKSVSAPGTELISMLEEATGTEAPLPLKALRTKRPRFNDCVEKSDMKAVIEKFLA
ncbi:MAG: threonine synthase [Oscillospiraceae bacterium]